MNLKERGNRHMGGLEEGKEIVAKLQPKKLKKSLSIRFMIFKLGLKKYACWGFTRRKHEPACSKLLIFIENPL